MPSMSVCVRLQTICTNVTSHGVQHSLFLSSTEHSSSSNMLSSDQTWQRLSSNEKLIKRQGEVSHRLPKPVRQTPTQRSKDEAERLGAEGWTRVEFSCRGVRSPSMPRVRLIDHVTGQTSAAAARISWRAPGWVYDTVKNCRDTFSPKHGCKQDLLLKHRGHITIC